MNPFEDILDSQKLSGLLFFPEETPIPRDLPPDVKILQFQMPDETPIGGLFFIKHQELPSILLFHGNGEIAENYAFFHRSFLECGANLAVIDYRGYGFSEGVPTIRNLIEDALPIYTQFVEWLKSNSFLEHVFIFGRSLGSICAAEIGSHNPHAVDGLIFESGFGDTIGILRSLFQIKFSDETAARLKPWSNDTKMASIKKPVLIIHGTDDYIVPFTQAHLIHQALQKSTEKILIPIEGAGHNDIQQYKEQYFSELHNFIQKYQF